jgi:hypothetical protein
MKIGRILGAVVVAINAATSAAAEPLARNNASANESSISGISSGAYMAVQFGTAWSSLIRGVGVVAGGPFWCVRADANDFVTSFWGPIFRATGSCMKGPSSDLKIADFIAKADEKAARGDLDPLDNLKQQKIYLFHGYNDALVARAVTDAAEAFYRHYLGNANRGNLFYQSAIGAGHALVVSDDTQAGDLNACNANDSPFIDRCGYDQAGVILQHIYGALNPPNRGQLKGALKSFDQSLYTKPRTPDGLSLGDTGYVFVPEACARGEACRVHIALHGCMQDVSEIGRRFIEKAGYNAWADTNRIIVLYPQARSSPFVPYNPRGCWDWWGYIDHTDKYVTKSGAQITAIKAMLDAVTGGAAAPASSADSAGAGAATLDVIDTSDAGVALAWKPQAGATSYRISRAGADGQFAPAGETQGSGFADTGLTPGTKYHWRVSAVVNGAEGSPFADVTATTRLTPAPCDAPGTCPISR